MRLLYVTQMYPSEELPQYCIFIHLQVKALIANGVDITVVIPCTEKQSQSAKYDDVDVIYLNYRDYSRSILYGLVSHQLKNELIRFVDVSDYDIVYAVHAPANIMNFARALSSQYHKPLVGHYRGFNVFEEYKPEEKVLFSNPKRMKERVVKSSALSIGVSRKIVNVITDRFPDAPVAVVYNGVDKSVFSESHEKNINENEFRLLCVANLIPIKGHKYLLDAVKALSEKHPYLKIDLDIVGRGFLEDELKQYVVDNSISNVHFHGYVKHEDVAEFMRKTDIFVLPSVYEAMANVCFEAMACHKPIVIFEGQGTDELIEDGISGMIAKKGDSKDLAAKIEELISNRVLRHTVAENGYRVVQRLTWDASAKSVIEVITLMISGE